MEQPIEFCTSKLEVNPWSETLVGPAQGEGILQRIVGILTPQVTQSLPEEWQGIHGEEDARQWIQERIKESHVLTVRLRSTGELIGFLFLYDANRAHAWHTHRIGYLIAGEHWGKGLGSELIKGLIDWCRGIKKVSSLIAGVETHNIGSIKVLEKNGFYPADEESKGTRFFRYDFP